MPVVAGQAAYARSQDDAEEYSQSSEKDPFAYARGMSQQQLATKVVGGQSGNLSSAQWPVTGEMVHGPDKVAPQFMSGPGEWDQETGAYLPGQKFHGSLWGSSVKAPPQAASLNMGQSKS